MKSRPLFSAGCDFGDGCLADVAITASHRSCTVRFEVNEWIGEEEAFLYPLFQVQKKSFACRGIR